MLAFIEQDSYAAAFVLAEEIESLIPNDPVLTDALAVSSVTGAIRTDPVGADVYVRAYGEPDAEWRFLGPSPLEAVRLPRSASVQLRVEAEGYATRVVASGAPGFYFGRGSPDVITLLPENEVPPEMVLIQGGDYPVRITGFNSGARIPMDAFLMDRHEVTNMEYKEFVDAGGYDQAEYWEGFDFVREGRPLSSEAAMAELVDASGRPGPATWEFGNFPQGQADYPVAGVSWYEAVAHLQFRDKSLPTIYHWARAAMEPHANATPLSTAMIPLANFGSDGPVPVGSTGAMAPHGALDLAGNVREWQWNAAGEHRWILGGAWDDETRMHSVRFTSPPFDRSSRHGFRGVRHLAGDPRAELMEPVDLQVRDHRDAVAVSDEIYEVYRSQMAYVPTELNESVEWRHEDPADWVIEHVTVDVSPDERMSIYLFLPKSVGPPYTPVVYFPGLGPFMQPPPEHSGDLMREEDLNSSARMVMQSGRAIVLPIWDGSFERWDDFLTRSGEEYLRSFRDRMADWAADVGRTIDLLERRDDISTETIGYMGSSFGASTTLALLGLEPRLGAALLLLPGYTYRDLPPEADAVNYAPRITMPVLMIGGRYNYVFPLETAQQPLYDQLGTPTAQKTFLTYEMGHGPFPRNQLLRDVLPWLDQYLPIVN
jgi:formylglycine-generating enzyme required for sulfatase activity/dienelactone hydrolase